ncbi:unnamed protein product [Ascophyllum nodosum]
MLRIRSGRGCRGPSNGTWRRIVAGFLFLLAGAAASDAARRLASAQPRARQTGRPVRYGGIKRAYGQLKADVRRALDIPIMIKELGSPPPKPLQVFEYGPSRLTYLLNPKKYRYQYVCVVSRMGTVEEGVWHKRRAPINWWRVPPFHLRIVRPNPAGMLDYMIAKKKINLIKKDVTIKRTDKRTGEVVRFTRPMFMVERTEVNLPRHLRKYVKAKKDGKNWEDRRRSVGRWGPSSDEKVGEKAVMELLGEAGIASKEEAESMFKRVDEDGEEYDIRDVMEFARTSDGRRALTKLEEKERRREAKKNKKQQQKKQQKKPRQ